MSPKLLFLLFLPMAFSLKKYPIVKIEKSLDFHGYLHCSKSPNDSIHLFYKISSNISHLIYDQNEELVSKMMKKIIYIKENILIVTANIYNHHIILMKKKKKKFI